VKHAPRLPPAAHVTIHLGIGNAPQALHAPSISPPFAVMLGRMTRTESYKGHHEVIAAWPLVVRQLPDAQLWIAGDGDLRPDLERQALECGLGQAVRFLGPVSDQEKERLLARARCLIMPSRGEGFGLVYIEAMRQGRPCLVSTVDAGREVVNPPEAGLAADLDSPDDLARASCRLLGSGAEWDTWSLRARQRYEREFTALAFQNRLRVALLPMLSFC
jgi:phosphatidylinositol alpha-1,6-mannosyltransferase